MKSAKRKSVEMNGDDSDITDDDDDDSEDEGMDLS